MNAILSEKGQVTIPKAIRDELGLAPGAVLDFSEAGGQIFITKVVAKNPIASWRGKGRLPIGKSVNEYLSILRGDQ